MKIECDKCGAKYSIADEKVRGKTFKIRCKKCSNVIIVRDKGAAAEAESGGAETSEDAGAAAGWHLAIDGETVGPMPEDEVRQRFAQGQIDRETAVWQEGFEEWMPLESVPAFADLVATVSAPTPSSDFGATDPGADRGAAHATDALAALSGTGSSFSEPAVSPQAATAREPAPVAEEHEAASSSPRVGRLTGQRNENSVLFSLDNLQSLATGGAQPAGGQKQAPTPRRATNRGLATAAPSSEGSGLIDIRALGAMVGADKASAPGAGAAKPEDVALPSFSGVNLGLASSTLIPAGTMGEGLVATGLSSPATPARSNGPLYVIAVLLAAILVMGAYMVFFKPTPAPVTVQPGSMANAPSLKDQRDTARSGDKAVALETEAPVEHDSEGSGGETEAADADKAESAGKPASSHTSTKSTKSTSPNKPDSGKSDSASKPASTTTPKSSTTTPPSKGRDISNDCILDPSKCADRPSSKPTKEAESKASAASNLPESISGSDIKAGIAPVKDAAKACGAKHNAPAGTKVKVKLSIAGATGTVTSAAAEAPHTGTPLGNCVAAALKKATFSKFQKTSLGVSYTVSM